MMNLEFIQLVEEGGRFVVKTKGGVVLKRLPAGIRRPKASAFALYYDQECAKAEAMWHRFKSQ